LRPLADRRKPAHTELLSLPDGGISGRTTASQSAPAQFSAPAHIVPLAAPLRATKASLPRAGSIARRVRGGASIAVYTGPAHRFYYLLAALR